MNDKLPTSSFQARLRLGAISAAVLLVWTIVLPWVGSWSSVRDRIDFLNERGIDPAALYYTDLEAMSSIEVELASLRDKHPDAFWQVRSRR